MKLTIRKMTHITSCMCAHLITHVHDFKFQWSEKHHIFLLRRVFVCLRIRQKTQKKANHVWLLHCRCKRKWMHPYIYHVVLYNIYSHIVLLISHLSHILLTNVSFSCTLVKIFLIFENYNTILQNLWIEK